MFRLSIFLLLLFFAGCMTSSRPEKKFPVLLPQADKSLKAYSSSEKPWIAPPLLYIGKQPDTVNSNKQIAFDTMWPPEGLHGYGVRVTFPGISDHLSKASGHKEQKSTFSILVDTTQKFNWSYNFQTDSTFGSGHCRFTPVLLTNTGKDSAFLYTLSLETEAKTSDGKWIPVTNHYRMKCLTGGPPLYFFPPGEVLLTAVPSFEGTQPTTFRVHFRNNGDFYSEEYPGTINPKLLGE